MMQTDVKSVAVAATGQAYAGRTRVRAITIAYASGGTVVLKDGTSTITAFSFTAPAAAGSIHIIVPGEGILFTTSVEATLSSATITVFYG